MATRPPAVTYKNLLGETITVQPRGKHYVEPRGYADKPGTGPEGETCGSCKHRSDNVMYSGKRFPKCALFTKQTGGRGSDILVRSPACSKWEKKDK